MKGHKGNHHRKHRETGGVNEAEQDLNKKNEARTDAKKIDGEAEERASGGRTGRKAGGKIDGKKMKGNAGRKPRKAGGRAYSDENPFTSARKGTPAKGRKLEMEFE